MRKSLIITDLTRMQGGRVCVAGYDEDGQCVRPVLPPPGISEKSLIDKGRPIVFPFALVEYEFLQHTPQPPHTEDYRYDPTTVRFVRRANDRERQEVLDRSLFGSVGAIFEETIHRDVGNYVMEGRGPRSLGTIRPQRIIKAIFEQDNEGKWKYRLGFVDGEGVTYWLTITDLAWRYCCDHERNQGHAPDRIASRWTSTLRASIVYLRIGLARGWEKYPGKCFLQITGVHTVPDCLGGKTFVDFAPPK